jgi:hypothetical protein
LNKLLLKAVAGATAGVLLFLPGIAHAGNTDDVAAAPTPIAPARTQPEPEPKQRLRRFEVGARLGAALPLGRFTSDQFTTDPPSSLNDSFTLKIPILVEVGYDVTPHLMLGLSVQYGFIIDKTGAETGCPDGESCSDHDIELGVQAQCHFAPGQRVDGWLGFGFGYEFESDTVHYSPGPPGAYESDFEGPQYAKLQGGVDLMVGDAMTVGPFLSFSLAEYTKSTRFGQTTSIPSTAPHEWLSLGVKGTFKIGG